MADFLQEVTSRKDQAQYWFSDKPYRFVPVAEMAEAFHKTQAAQRTRGILEMPYDRAACPEGSLVRAAPPPPPPPPPPLPAALLRGLPRPAPPRTNPQIPASLSTFVTPPQLICLASSFS